ncbi:hypothetical protein BHE74_00020810 [Ensete ventricosum]|nr:hypothetical protein BHE74_00020810 [Ensete ventricosum]
MPWGTSSFPLLLLPYFFFNQSPMVDFSLNRSLTVEINSRRSILAVPSSSGRFAYRSAAELVRTGWYGALPLATYLPPFLCSSCAALNPSPRCCLPLLPTVVAVNPRPALSNRSERPTLCSSVALLAAVAFLLFNRSCCPATLFLLPASRNLLGRSPCHLPSPPHRLLLTSLLPLLSPHAAVAFCLQPSPQPSCNTLSPLPQQPPAPNPTLATSIAVRSCCSGAIAPQQSQRATPPFAPPLLIATSLACRRCLPHPLLPSATIASTAAAFAVATPICSQQSQPPLVGPSSSPVVATAAIPLHLPCCNVRCCHCCLLPCHCCCPASFFLPCPTSIAVVASAAITLCSSAQPHNRVTVAPSSSPPYCLSPLPTAGPTLLTSPSPLSLLPSPPRYRCFPAASSASLCSRLHDRYPLLLTHCATEGCSPSSSLHLQLPNRLLHHLAVSSCCCHLAKLQ